MVDDRRLLGDTEWIGQRQYLHRQAYPYAFGTGGNRAGPDERGCEYGALRSEMRFAQPEGVEAYVFGNLHHVKPFLKGLRLGKTFAGSEHGEDPEVHRRLLSCQL
jgi:hypothetical protein